MTAPTRPLGTPPGPVATATSPADAVLAAAQDGYAALLVTGRSLYDLVTDTDGRLLTIVEHLRRRLLAERSMHLITYALAPGLDWDVARVADQRDRATIEAALRAHHLLEVNQDEHEPVRILRGIASLARTGAGNLSWASGEPMRFGFLLEFAEHLTPNGDTSGRTDQEIAAVEVAHVLGQSNALRQSGNLVIFHGREGRIDPLVVEALRTVRVRQPDEGEKHQFLTAAAEVYPNARFEVGITAEIVARLTANTPNCGVEGQLRASHRAGTPVTVDRLLAQKAEDVVALSEGTLSVLDVRRIRGLDLVGQNIAAPRELLLRFGESLLHANPYTPANVILVGSPGNGKTDLALLVADQAKASAYQLHSPKGGLVGETERRSERMTTALREWTPNVAFVDEITEVLPLERNDVDLDSGASRAVTGALLTTLSDESRRGRSLLVATTNCPWRIGGAMRTRFTMVPVLSPLQEDFPAILAAVVRRIAPDTVLQVDELLPAADLFHRKGASPREIRGALSHVLLQGEPLTPEALHQAARDLNCGANLDSARYADLWAVKVCGSKRFFPWHGRLSDYRFPEHLKGLVDPLSGEVDERELNHRIEQLRPYANV